MRNLHPLTLIKPHILHQIIRIRLLPISAGTILPTNTTQIPTIILIIIRLHERRCTPRVSIERLDAILLRLLAHKQLSGVFPVPGVAWHCGGRRHLRDEDGVHEIGARVGGRADPVAEDGHSCSGGGVEEYVEDHTLFCGGEVDDLVGALEGFGEAEAVDCLICFGDIDAECHSALLDMRFWSCEREVDGGCQEGKEREMHLGCDAWISEQIFEIWTQSLSQS